MIRDHYLKDRYSTIFSYTGLILFIGGLIMSTPLLVLIARPEEKIHALSILMPSMVLILIGSATWRLFRSKYPTALSAQEGGIIVLFSWIVVSLFSALPFRLILKLSITHSVFESVSGWTTTGLSVIDVSAAPHMILIWRSIMQLAGGAGLAIIMLSAIAGPKGTGLSTAEGREQLVPNVRQSAKLVLSIYTGYVLVGIAAYRIGGMSFFDAVNHAFSALSTGGFSTRAESIGYWNSARIEYITIMLMILGNLNFLMSYTILHGKFRAFLRNGEIRVASILILLSSITAFSFVCVRIYPTVEKSIRVALFESVSALTTTGFSTVGYGTWNSYGFLILIILMVIGGGTCSTAGGIKQYRLYVLLKSIIWDIRRTSLPQTAVVENYIWHGQWKDFIDDSRIRRISNFIFIYLLTLAIGTSIFTVHGFGLKESLFEFSSALGTVGLSAGITNSTTSGTLLWTEIAGMFLGRLEFFVVITSMIKVLKDFFTLIKQS